MQRVQPSGIRYNLFSTFGLLEFSAIFFYLLKAKGHQMLNNKSSFWLHAYSLVVRLVKDMYLHPLQWFSLMSTLRDLNNPGIMFLPSGKNMTNSRLEPKWISTAGIYKGLCLPGITCSYLSYYPKCISGGELAPGPQYAINGRCRSVDISVRRLVSRQHPPWIIATFMLLAEHLLLSLP